MGPYQTDGKEMVGQMITDVRVGYVKIDGKLQTHDFIIHDDVVTDGDWKRGEPGSGNAHIFEVEDIPLSVRQHTRILIIGVGMEGKLKLSHQSLKQLTISDLEVFIVPTDEAADIYNEARRLGKTGVTGAFHVRC